MGQNRFGSTKVVAQLICRTKTSLGARVFSKSINVSYRCCFQIQQNNGRRSGCRRRDVTDKAAGFVQPDRPEQGPPGHPQDVASVPTRPPRRRPKEALEGPLLLRLARRQVPRPVPPHRPPLLSPPPPPSPSLPPLPLRLPPHHAPRVARHRRPQVRQVLPLDSKDFASLFCFLEE